MAALCPTHGRIPVPHPPKHDDCSTCWAGFGRWCSEQIQKSGVKSVGRARGGGRSSKAKGRAGSLAAAVLLREFLELAEADVFVKATSQIGVDLHLSEVARLAFPFSIEVKNVETLSIWAALRQAEENATPEMPAVLFFKRAGTRMYVALDAAIFLQKVNRAHQSKGA